ncbi:MAG: hypothetical protein ACOY5F_03440 [Pseudomonadota bacterium]
MTLRTVYAAIIAVSLVGGSHLAVHYAIDAVARAGTLESRLFQPELPPSGRRHAIALAQTARGSIR